MGNPEKNPDGILPRDPARRHLSAGLLPRPFEQVFQHKVQNNNHDDHKQDKPAQRDGDEDEEPHPGEDEPEHDCCDEEK